MGDIEYETELKVSKYMEGELAAGARLVVVVNPATLTGGNVLFDKTVPAGKTFEGAITIAGKLV